MSSKKNMKKSLLMLGIMAIMMFAMCITSMAASTVTGVTQTKGTESSVTITFTGDVQAYGYYVYYSLDGSTYVRSGHSTSSYPDTYNTEEYISGLSAGTQYYVKVVPVYKDSNYNYIPQNDKASDVITVVTTPTSIASSSLKQTDATANSVTLSWQAVAGATGYNIIKNNSVVSYVTGTSATLKTSAGSYESYRVCAVKISAAGYKASGSTSSVSCQAAPGKPVNLASYDDYNLTWKSYSSNKVTVGWNKNSNDYWTPDGYQLQIYSVKGKKLKTYNITSKYTTSKTFTIKAVKNTGFQCRVRAYINVNNKKCYGSWTSKKTVIPEAKINLSQKSKTSVKVSWTKVKNATKYTIYACKNTSVSKENQKWYKVATVGKNTTSYTVKKLTSGKDAGFYVIPTVKVNKKTYKAQATWYLYKYMSTYY